MVLYFTSNVVSPAAFIYVGKDKVENEELIKYGLEEDFHVDNLSSAHVYVRLRDGETWDSIPPALLEDCAQLTKANSIEGNKKDNITVIYTPWSNLKKDGSMAVGQVGFKDQKKVKKVHVPQRENPTINRLNKTKVEKFPDLRQEKQDREKELRRKDKALSLARQKEEARVAKERRELAWQRDHAYDDLHADDAVMASSNQDRNEDFLDDFM
ncbi:coiled-coil domain-containing protein 25 [Cryomyces antarcticus]